MPIGKIFNGEKGLSVRTKINLVIDAVNDLVVSILSKVDKVTGKDLSSNDYTTAEKNKLGGIAENANNYTHPANHDPSIITQDANNRFVTDSEKNTWNGKQDAIGFTPENTSNKTSSFQATPDDTKFPTEKLVKDELDKKVDKVTGKALSTNDYDNTEKAKVTSNTLFKTNYQTILKEFTGFTNNKNITVNYNKTTGKVTLTGTFEAYWQGVKIDALVSGWESPALLDTYAVPNEVYFLYYNGTNFIWSDEIWTFDMLQIADVIYDSAGTFQLAQREVHGFMQYDVHNELHYNIGTRKISGGTIDSTTITLLSKTETNRRPSVLEGVIKDEDLESTIGELNKATEKYTHLFLNGASSEAYFDIDKDDIVQLSAGGLPQYNAYAGSSWGLLTIPNNNFMCVFLVEFPSTSDADSQKKRFMWMHSQTYGTIDQMRALEFNSLNFGNITGMIPEFVASQKVIIKRSGNSAGDWFIQEVITLTGSKVLTVQQSGSFLSAVTTDNSLSGNGTVSNPLSTKITTEEQVDNYELILDDAFKMIDMNKGTALTLTVPKNSSVAFAIGTIITVRQTGDGQLTIAPVDGDVVLQYPIGLKIIAKYGMATLVKVATNTWAVTGMLEA